MTFPGGGPFNDASFENIFGRATRPSGQSNKTEEKGIPWEAKVIDGRFYVPLRQVGELLEQNKVLPKVTAGIKRRVETGPPKKEDKT